MVTSRITNCSDSALVNTQDTRNKMNKWLSKIYANKVCWYFILNEVCFASCINMLEVKLLLKTTFCK
jgi:hypothetical protein